MPEPFVQSVAGVDLTIEQATDRSPDKRKYHVFHDGKLVGSYSRMPDAQAHFKRLRDASGWKPPKKVELSPEELLSRDIEARERSMYSEYWGQAHKYRTGGRPKRK